LFIGSARPRDNSGKNQIYYSVEKTTSDFIGLGGLFFIVKVTASSHDFFG
jgi:hypothetical protein